MTEAAIVGEAQRATSQSKEVLRRGVSEMDVMLAAEFSAPRTVRIVQRPLPVPGPGQVRLRLQGCGVCGSNLPTWEGRPWFEYPMEAGAPGHEGWGFVDAVGDAVENVVPGDRVAALSYHAFATHDIADARAVLKVPQDLIGRPVPGEPLACAVNVFRRASMLPGETVAVVGLGFLGALLTMLASEAGARVVAISRRSFALDVGVGAGAVQGVRLTDPADVARQTAEIAPEGFDCVIEAVGNQDALDVASALTRTRGRLVVAGYHQDGARSVNMQDWNWKGIDVINAHERDPDVYRAGMQDAVERLARGRWNPDVLYTHTFPLEALSEALQMMQERPDGFLKAIVSC